jgi:serine/threonine protein kinase
LEEIKKFLKHIVLAYRSLYDSNIIHRDIKPANILLLTTGGFKLTDFGMGRIIEDTNKR